MRKHATKGDCGANQCVELFVTANGKLEVAGRDALYLEVLGSILSGGKKLAESMTQARAVAIRQQGYVRQRVQEPLQ